jgi:hypothetical protein
VIGAVVVSALAGVASADVVSLVGDKDNFGYGGTDNPPNEYYDLSEAEDVGVFDRELNDGDEIDRWVHTFTLDAAVVSASISIPEIFSDFAASTISFDGQAPVLFAQGTFSNAGPFIVRTFNIDPALLADGELTVEFLENGDDVALDYSELTIKTIPAPASLAMVGLAGLAGTRRRRA